MDKQNVSKYLEGDFSFIVLSNLPLEIDPQFEVGGGERNRKEKRDK